MSIYPSSLSFKEGKTRDRFWVSLSNISRGTDGGVLFLIDGDGKDSYTMRKRLRSFKTVRSDNVKPIIFRDKVF